MLSKSVLNLYELACVFTFFVFKILNYILIERAYQKTNVPITIAVLITYCFDVSQLRYVEYMKSIENFVKHCEFRLITNLRIHWP